MILFRDAICKTIFHWLYFDTLSPDWASTAITAASVSADSSLQERKIFILQLYGDQMSCVLPGFKQHVVLNGNVSCFWYIPSADWLELQDDLSLIGVV